MLSKVWMSLRLLVRKYFLQASVEHLLPLVLLWASLGMNLERWRVGQ